MPAAPANVRISRRSLARKALRMEKADSPLIVRPIGTIRTPFVSAPGAPVQSRYAEGIVEVLPEFAVALRDIEGFERIWLL